MSYGLRAEITALISNDRNTSDICDDVQTLLLDWGIDERSVRRYAVELVESGRASNAVDRDSRFQMALRYVLFELQPRTVAAAR